MDSSYRGSSETSSTISASRFATVFERFRKAVAAHRLSDEPFKSFATGLPYRWEFYKEWVYHQARHLLAPHKWKQKDIGNGRILKCVLSSIEIYHDITLRNNMVQWDARWGEHGKAHKQILAARNNRNAREKIERLFYLFYRGRLDAAKAFDSFALEFGKRYDLIAYLMFIRDWEQFMPVKPMIFERAFAILGMPLSMSGNASWENYSAFLTRIRAVQVMLTKFGVPAVRFVDAHSFCWMLSQLDISASISAARARYQSLIPQPGDPPPAALARAGRFTAGQSEIDYDELERLGALAQSIVLDAERKRLTAADRADLAARVRDVSDDALLGYDVASFMADGQPKPVEVKAAARRGSSLRFFISANEWRRSKTLANYTLALVMDIRSRHPLILEFAGALLPEDALHPANYEVRLRRPHSDESDRR